ncbi:MAG: DMT family transporter [Anaerolineae bacterium]|jgi:drug/metabolite transporter (DMT)-like permease
MTSSAGCRWVAPSGPRRFVISRGRGALYLSITVLIWGSTLVVTQAAMRHFGPVLLVLLRFGIAFMLLLPLAWRRGFRWRHALQPDSLLLGLTGLALFYMLQNLGLAYTSAASASLILAGVPIATALLEALVQRQRLRRTQWLGISLAVLGTAMVGGAQQATTATNPVLGNLLILGCVGAWAAYTLLLKRVPAGRDILCVTVGSFGAGILMVLPFAIWETVTAGLPQPDLLAVGAVLYLSVAASGLTMWFWNMGVQVLEASTATTFVNLVPVMGLGIALLAGDSVSLWQALGGVLALGGVWISARRPRPAPAPAREAA